MVQLSENLDLTDSRDRKAFLFVVEAHLLQGYHLTRFYLARFENLGEREWEERERERERERE